MSHHEALELYDYQEAILGHLRDGFIAGHRCQMLVAPTGAGKTEMAMELLEAASFKGNRAAMVLDRIVLCNQTSERLDKYGMDHGVLQAGHWRFRPDRLIQVCSAQTLEKRGSFPNLKLLIVDEAHQIRAQTMAFIMTNPSVKVVGLSATPFTKGLGKTYTNVVSAISTRELVTRGRLAPLRVFIAKEIDMTGAKKVAGEWSARESQARGMAVTGDIVAEWVKKTHEVFGGPRKTVVFASGVAHAADLAQKFSEAGYNFVSLSYKDDDDFKAEAIKDFAKPDTAIHGLIATDILTKGFDVPDVMIGVSARPFSKSLASHIQQMGRVMRSSPGKEFALWLCHSGNYLRFQEDWDDIYANGVNEIDEGREKPKKELTANEKEAAKCPSCSHVWPRNVDVCPCCGFVRQRRNEVIAVPGELHELAGKMLAETDRAKRQSFFGQLLTLAQERNYSEGWSAHKFKEKFGVWPRGLLHVAEPITPEVVRWVKSRQIAWAKAKRREAVDA
jgi:superfamily II DNA or RNA helicase